MYLHVSFFTQGRMQMSKNVNAYAHTSTQCGPIRIRTQTARAIKSHPFRSRDCALKKNLLRMGFFASYKRLSRRARIILGLVGVATGLAGPYIVPLLPTADEPEEKQRLNEETAVRETTPS